MREKLSGLPARSLFAATLVAVVPQAFAISLGEIDVRSTLGEALDVRIPLGISAGDVVDANCFALARDPEPGVPVIAEGLLTVERSAERTSLRIRSTGPVFEPAVRVGVRAACPGQSDETLQQYSVLLDPPRRGDTLESLATKVFPRNRAARDRYLEAMREVNPALASLGNNDPVPDGANVALPDLRTSSRRARGQTVARSGLSAATRSPSSDSAPSGGFVLKLSGNPMDLSPTRGVDDRTRAKLRERLLILDSDDQVSTVLALREHLTQLEARVNELQLKLAQMPASFPARPAAEVPAAQPPELPKMQPASATAEPAKEAEAAAASPAPAKPALRQPRPAPTFHFSSLWQTYGLWAAFIAVLALLMLFAWRLNQRRQETAEMPGWDQAAPGEAASETQLDASAEEDALEQPLPDAGALRQRYIEERFPEVLNATLVLDDPASVVKGARLFYEDGAMPRAVELLQFAIEENASEVRTWLALFEIYRLERLTGEFAELARRFYEHHGATEYWRKIRYFGREIDPGNFIYREDVDALETIAPGTSRRASLERFDPARENWLDAPMDFDNEVLANELRQALMAAAGVTDQDLVPNPMPALRDAEMFTVA